MRKMIVLQKLFARYANLGAHSVSLRGCYEKQVPKTLIEKMAAEQRNNNRKK